MSTLNQLDTLCMRLMTSLDFNVTLIGKSLSCAPPMSHYPRRPLFWDFRASLSAVDPTQKNLVDRRPTLSNDQNDKM